ncbi:MAG: hypothetical protein GY765_15190 [bacterium]|nr:hypothetical protein [bacterium]
MKLKIVLMILVLAASLPLLGGSLKSKGEIALENRLFQKDDADLTKDGNMAVFARLQGNYKTGPFRVGMRVFGRVDKADSGRSLFGVEEAWVGFRKSGWDIRAGARMLNWSATEAFHPADMINSRNLDSDIENWEKLGELMLSVKRRVASGSVTLFVMPRYEAPEFASEKSRLSFLPAGLEVGKALWLESDGEISSDVYGLQWGARVTQSIGPSDISLHYIQHQDRNQPVMLPGENGAQVVPVYLPVRDIGATYLQVLGGWIFKLELNYRDFDNPSNPVYTTFAGPVTINREDHGQVALGVEYGWAYKGGSEATVIVEGQGLFGVNKDERAILHPFQRDMLVGYRHAWNDVMSRELLVTTIFDVEGNNEFMLNASYKQRLNDTWGLRLGFRLVNAPIKDRMPIGLEALHKTNQVYFTLTKYF